MNLGIDFKKVGIWNIPPKYRNVEFWQEFVFALLQPAKDLHDIFLAYAAIDVEQRKYNAQTIVLNTLLQSKFDAGVYISNLLRNDGSALYAENVQAQTPKLYAQEVQVNGWALYDESVALASYNFTVNYPASAGIDLVRLNATVRQYAHTGFTWQLVSY
jgi:hypothetical protein